MAEMKLDQKNVNNDKKQKDGFCGLAVTSLAIGSFMVMITLFVWYIAWLIFWGPRRGGEYIISLYVGIGFIINSIGLATGILGLWSNRKKMAIVGIILCSLLYIPIIFLLLHQLS